MSREVSNYDGLLAGEVYTIVPVSIATSQTVKRGDLLVCSTTDGVPGTTFSKAAANPTLGKLTVSGAVSSVSLTDYIYAIAAEDITTSSSATGKITAYTAGYFNKSKVGLPLGFSDGNKYALLARGIVLRDAQSGAIS